MKLGFHRGCVDVKEGDGGAGAELVLVTSVCGTEVVLLFIVSVIETLVYFLSVVIIFLENNIDHIEGFILSRRPDAVFTQPRHEL